MKKVFCVCAVVAIMPHVATSGHCAESLEANTSFQLDPIVVTAEKIPQDLQRIPGAVNAYGKKVIEERHVENFYNLSDYVPNVFIRRNSTENIISIRGISPQQGSLFSATGMYVDGVNYPIHQMQNLDFLDIERVEVLKGPQGTLYGRNSEAGVVNVITAAPTADDFGGKVYGGIGMWKSTNKPIFKEGAVVNLPIVRDKLAMRVAAQGYSTDGWMENVAPGGKEDAARVEHFNGRVTTRWTPSDAWDFSFIVQGQHGIDGIGVYRFVDGPYATNRNTLAWDGPNRSSSDGDAEILKVEFHGDQADIASITARHRYTQDYSYDVDMTPQDLYYPFSVFNAEYDVKILSEEFRVSSKPGEGRLFDWLAGTYLYTEDVATGNYSMTDHIGEQDNWGAALFAQGTLNLWETWHFNLGGRVEYARLEGKKTVNDRMSGKGVVHLEDTVDDAVFLPSASISHDLAEDVLVYIKTSRGYLAGGFDNYFSMSDEQYTYEPEFSWNYEVGLKNRMLDNRLVANLAAFYIDSVDKQVTEYISPYERYFLNAGKVESYGAELDVQYKPLPGLTLNGSAGWLESKIKDWTATGYRPYDYSGKETPGAPNFSWTAGALYHWLAGFYIGIDVVGVGSYYSTAENDRRIDGHTLVNARMGYEGEQFEIMLWAHNLFDEDYEERSMRWMDGTLVQQGEPMSLGVLLTYKF